MLRLRFSRNARTQLLTGLLLGLAGCASVPNPARTKIEYRPGGYFPEGFPLHGQVRLLTAPLVEMGQRARIRIEYAVGDIPIETGTAVEIWKHFTSDAEEFQVADREAPAWFGAELTAPGAAARTVAYTNWVQRNDPSVFPYRKCGAAILQQGRLKQGDKILFDLGGPQGVRMQHYEESLFNFRVVITREGKVLGYGGDAALQVQGGPLRKLRVQAPSIVKAGEPFPVEIVPLDEWVSLARNYQGLSFRVVSGSVSGADFRYHEDLRHYVARAVTAKEEGVLRIGVETADGGARGLSNPIWVERDPLRRVWFGELHQHTYLADGRGVFQELYLHARRVGLLDFAAITPHHMPMSVIGPSFYLEGKRWPSENWPELARVTQWMNGWEGMATILGYEYSVGTQIGGHHNVFYNADRALSTMQLDPAAPSAPIAKMLKTLQLARVPVMVIPHIGGGPPDWTHPPDQRLERLFEIASVHGVFEESWQCHLKAGLRQGAIAAGDTHTTSMGLAYPGLIYVNSNGLTGVYALGRGRQQIWDALGERRSFACSSSNRALLSFEVNGEPMGGEISSRLTPQARIAARLSATAPILRVELLKNCQVIHALHPARGRGKLVRVVWGDNLYQRRACVGLREGELRPESGRLRLRQTVHLDQAFEQVEQQGERIRWKTAAVSNDRDGFLVDISEAAGGFLHFRLDDADTVGLIEARIPLAQLERDGFFFWRQKARPEVKHPYMAKMGVDPAFFLECELVNPDGPLDVNLNFEDREPLRPGDYYYVRMEQLDTNRAWSSPVWVN